MNKQHPLNTALQKLARALPEHLRGHAAELTSRDRKRVRRSLNRLASALERGRNDLQALKFSAEHGKAWERDAACATAVAHLRAVMWTLRAKEPAPEALTWANARVAAALHALSG